ncbi:MAG: ATP-binding protein [Synergistaceae bacterium]|nr:ATP-binding protein [Synergistaceae bacterium]
MIFMLLAYGGRNCWSFREWMEIDLRVNKNVAQNVAFHEKKVVPSMCFEGANASGKTCALRVLSFIYDFCLNSFFYSANYNSNIPFDTFFHNNDTSSFFISFCLGHDFDTEYTYEVEIDKSKIHSERLLCKKGKIKEILFKRRYNKIILNSICEKQNGIIYKDTASFISTLIQYGVKEINPFAQFFRNINSNVRYQSTFDDPMTDYVARFYWEHPDLHNRVIQQLKAWDTGIQDIDIIPVTDSQGKDNYMSVFVHDSGSENNRLYFSVQSNGTKLLYNRLKDIFLTLDTGGVLIFDEIDTHLHSEFVPAILRFFTDYSLNKNNSQIIFSSHSAALLDSLKKYRVYLFKKIHSESICYRIDELKGNNLLRNDRSLEQLYKSGVLGGLPDVS